MTTGAGGDAPVEPPINPAEPPSEPPVETPAEPPTNSVEPPVEAPAATKAAAPPPPPPVPSVKGLITSLEGEEDALLTLEDGRAACIRKLDLADAQGKISANVGDTIEAVIDTDHPPAEGAPIRLKRRSSPR